MPQHQSTPTSPAALSAPKRKRGGSKAGRRYDSALMQTRRERILSEAQNLLSEVGIESFTINELSRRAEVAQRTLYRNLGSREEIIARAITRQHDHLLAGMPEFIGRTLQDYLDRATVLARLVIGLRPYATAMVTVFFSLTIDQRIFNELALIPLRSFGNIFEDGVASGILRPMHAGERALLMQRMPHISYGNVNDWAAGRISDEEYLARAPLAFLFSVHPYLTDAARLEADAILAAQSVRFAPPD